MKTIIKTLSLVGFGALMSLAMPSCTDYLDKAPDSDNITQDDAFKSFTNFQGYVELLYHNVPAFATGYWSNSFNWGEDELIQSDCDYHMGYKIDNGDFWGWQKEYDGWGTGWLDRNDFQYNDASDASTRFHKGLWPCAWWGIRACNQGLANIQSLTEATTEQKNAIEGQLLFFRGWYHFMLIQYFGGLPYLDNALNSNSTIDEARLSYHECADKCAADFRRAADLLPINWDNTSISSATNGNNQLRVNKIIALAYLGKNYLWAASPLMNKELTGSTNYNAEYAKKAAEAFGELLNLVENGQTQYKLVDFANYPDIFYSYGLNGRMPGSTEALFRYPNWGPWQNTRYGFALQFMPADYCQDGGVKLSATANYVAYYGMANGLPLDDPDSGFDKTHPWKDRDPRFYNDIRYDGTLVSENFACPDNLKYFNMYSGSAQRDVNLGSRTGYMLQKFIKPDKSNQFDDGWGWSPQMTAVIPYLRLGDVYLMYAEAAVQAYNDANGKASNSPLTALEAFNAIRARAGVEPMNAKFSGSVEGFMSELRRERAVELAYEGHRFNDLRRWLLLDKYPYTIKTAQEFDRAGEFNEKNPKENAVSNFREVVLVTRNFGEKHYWLPLKRSDVNMSPNYPQNPGW